MLTSFWTFFSNLVRIRTQNYKGIMKTEWLIINVTAVRSPARAESEFVWGIFDVFVGKSHRGYFYHCCFYGAAILTVDAQNPSSGVTSKPNTVTLQLFLHHSYLDLIVIVHRGSK